MNSNHLKFSALFLFAAVLVSCGGGSSSSGGTTTVRSAYVANFGDGTISQYTIDGTGALHPIIPSTVPSIVGTTLSNPTSVTVVPSGKYAYVANSGDYVISQFTVGAGGALVPMSTPTVPSGLPGSAPFSVTVDPMGKYAFAANSGSNDVTQFTIGVSGALTNSMTTAAGTNPASVTVDPTGKYAYVVNSGFTCAASCVTTPGSVSQYNINATTGALTANSAPVATGGTDPISITVGPSGPSGTYAYVVNFTSANITQYTLAGGALTAPTSVATGTNPTSIAIDKNGTYAYVTDGNGVTRFIITNGGLSSPLPTPTGGFTPRSVTIDASGKYLFVADQGGNISQFTIGALGLPSAPTVTSGAASSQPYSITTAVSLH